MANHISNGVFETNIATGATQTPDGWTATSSTPDLQTDGGYEWAGSYMPGDLDAASGGGYATMFTNASKFESLQTTLNTSVQAGQTYTFSVDFYVNETDGVTNQGGVSTLEITIGSQTLTIQLDSTGQTAPYWQTADVTFTANETTDSLEISTQIDPGPLGFTGLALDNLHLDVASDYVVSGTSGDDTIDADYLDDPQNDRIDATDHSDGSNDDVVEAGAGNDIINAGAGNDTILGESGDDTILLEDGFGDDQITGGEAGESAGDTLDASAVTTDLTLELSGADPESGSLSDGLDTTTFSEIETVVLGSGNDMVTGSSGDDSVRTGAGADLVDGGAGNDLFDIGAADGAQDQVVLADGDGNDTIRSFEGPTDNGDGTFTGADQVDVSNLTSDGTTPVTTADVTVSDDGTGNAVLTFPGGESLTLIGIGTWQLPNAAALEALGIPTPTPDYIVEGTDNGELINAGYGGDPEGDSVDNNDNLESNNDDVIQAFGGNDIIGSGAGNDSVDAGTGDDQVYAETGDDTVLGGAGNDSVLGEAGNDSISGDAGNDTLLGGTGDDNIAGGTDDDSLRGEAGNDTLTGGSGDDYAHGGSGNDSISGGSGDDEMHGWYGNDTITGDAGNDYIDGDLGADLAMGGAGNDTIVGGYSTESDTLIGGSGDDSIDGQAGDDLIEGGTGNDVLIGADGDDTFALEDSFGNDAITGGETDETEGDTLDLSALSTGVTLDLSASDPEAGTLSNGTATTSFTEIENIVLGNGDDTLVLADGGGSDSVQGFEGPINNGDGTYSGQDRLDVSGLTDADGNPVTVTDVTVSDDGSGNAVLTFPGGENLTLVGIAPADVSTHAALEAIGIPNGLNYVVEGTGGADTIDSGYLGDPDGDLVDAGDSPESDNDDSIEAGDGDDIVHAGAGNDTVQAGAGNDNAHGGAGNDQIFGLAGNDTLEGGAGDDTLSGGAGNDTVTLGANDSGTGGDGDDVFLVVDQPGDSPGTITIVGGEGDETNGDTLVLSDGVTLSDITFTNTDDSAGGLSGTFTTAGGSVVNFSEIENIVCFTKGTRILTPHGERPIETLKLGDLVVTRDHGLRPIRWIGARDVAGYGRFAPIALRSEVAGPAQGGDLVVSPQHRILFTGYRAELLFGESEVLVPAKHLLDGGAVRRVPQDKVTYMHIMFDRHEVIYANGIATESFHAGDIALTAVEDAAREELFQIFPELRSYGGLHQRTARTCLKKHEADLLRNYLEVDQLRR